MGSFKTSPSGGNVVHRIDLGSGSRLRPRVRSRVSARAPRLLGGPERGVSDGRAPQSRVAAAPSTIREDADVIPAAIPRPSKRVAAEAAALDRPRSTGARTGDGASRHQIDLLERRLAKMARLLEAKEQEVAKVASASGEPGVASVFREVQGLEGSGEEVQRKKDLMSRIFEANLDLRKQIISG